MNFIITIFVGLIMLVGAGMTYHYRMLDAEIEGNPLGGVAMVSPTQFVKNVAAQHAALPKWDDKNWKGLTYKSNGTFTSASAPAPKTAAASAAKNAAAPKQNR